MHVPIRCITCGLSVGHVDDLFRYERTRRVKDTLKGRNTLPTLAAIDAGLQIDCSDILDRLGVVHDCCRTTLISAMVFSDYY